MISKTVQKSGVKVSSGRKFRRGLITSGMLVVLLVSALFFGVLSCALGEQSPETTGPRIEFQQEVIDLGTATPGQELYAEFVFRNVGKTTLIIEEITTEVATEGC